MLLSCWDAKHLCTKTLGHSESSGLNCQEHQAWPEPHFPAGRSVSRLSSKGACQMCHQVILLLAASLAAFLRLVLLPNSNQDCHGHDLMCSLTASSDPHIAMRLLGQHIMLVQSRCEVVSEAENILSELTHQLTHVIKGPPENGQQPQSRGSDLQRYSQQMYTRLIRWV